MPTTLAAPIRGLVGKIRNGNLTKRLDSAVAEIERLEQARQKILKEIANRYDVSRFDEVVANARAKFEKERTVEAETNMILMELVSQTVESRIAPVRLARMRAQMTGGVTEEWNTFNSQFPMWRDCLRRCCESKLENAKKEFLEIESQIAPQLRELGFDAEQVANHPQIKRALNEVSRWEGAPARCIEEKDGEHLWKSLIGRFCQEQ